MDSTIYNNILYFLTQKQFPENLNPDQQETLKKQSANYYTDNNFLYKIDKNTKKKIRVIRAFEMEATLFMFHNDPLSAHASTERMMNKMRTRYYWPQMYEDIREYVRSCDICQRRGKYRRTEPLHPIPVGEPFYRIGIDYVGPLPRTKEGNKYIIVAMDYLTKWPEARPTKEATAATTIDFIYDDIVCRHGCPGIIQTDRGTHFNNQLLKKLVEKFKIEHVMSTPYHPQTNGLVERFNRTLIESLARTAHQHLNEWDKFVAPALFSYRTSKHSTTRISPFYLVYGREAKLPVDSTQIEEEPSLVHHLEYQIDELPILRKEAQKQIAREQQKQKDRHDEKLAPCTQFQIGDLVLYYRATLDNQRSHKLDPKWKGPYYIHAVVRNGAYKLREQNEKVLVAPVNGKYLKEYRVQSLRTPANNH